MEPKLPEKEKSSRTHLVTYLLLITIVFVIAAVVGYRSYQHLYYRQGLRHDNHDDEESLLRHQRHHQQPNENSSLLRSDHLQRDAGKSSVSEQTGRGALGQIGISNLSAIPPGNSNNTTTTTKTKPTTMTTSKIRIHQLDPSIAYSKRLITIGDVHGCIATLEALLEKLAFNPDRDHLIFTGDIINKGPDSVGVVEFARKYGASAVRGNHEDKILRLRHEMGLSNGHAVGNGDASHKENGVEELLSASGENEEEDDGDDDDDDDSSDSSSSSDSGKDKKKDKKLKKEEKKEKKKLKKEQKKDKKDKKDKKEKKDKKGKKDKKDKKSKKKDKSRGTKGKVKTAREQHLAQLLSPDQVHWLESLPMILRVGHFPDMGETIVVHAGIVPGVPLEEQDPWDTMNMRSIHFKKGKREVTDAPDGTMWADLFKDHQLSITAANQPMTVIYGHDARSSLRIEKHTKGLDTACIKGGKLTAFVFENGGNQNVVQVPCVDNVEGAD